RRVAAGTYPAKIEDLQPGLGADVHEAGVEGHAAVGLARAEGADEVLAGDGEVAEVRDRVRRQRLSAQRENLRAEAEDAVRRLVEGTGRRVARHELQRAVSLEVTGKGRRGRQHRGGNCNQNDPEDNANTSVP